MVPEVAGSNPVFHPEDEKPRISGAFLLPGILLDLNAVEVVINPWRLMIYSMLTERRFREKSSTCVTVCATEF